MKTLFAGALLALAVAAPAAAAGLQDDLLAREKALWQAWADKDGEAFRAAATEDYVQIVAGVGAVAGREAVVQAVESHDCTMKSFAFTDAQLRQPTPEVAILTYVATQNTTCGGKPLPSKVAATAIWVLRDGQWMDYHYQESVLD